VAGPARAGDIALMAGLQAVAITQDADGPILASPWRGGSSMPQIISQFLHVHRAAVATRWYAKVRESLPQGGDLTAIQTMDSMGIFLEEMIRSLRQDGRVATGNDVAREHGRQRHGLGTGLPELVKEYGLCSESMVEIAHELGETLSADSQVALSRFLFLATAEAVDEYVMRAAERQRQSGVDHLALIAQELTGPLSVVQLSLDVPRERLSDEATATLHLGLSRANQLLQREPGAAPEIVAPVPELQIQPLPLHVIVKEAMQHASAQASQRGVTLKSEIDPSQTVAGDRSLLLSALSQLILNAAKCTKLGSVVTTRAKVAEGRLVVEVQDQCGGLDSQRIAVVFSAFRAQSSSSTAPQRSVGLAVTAEAIEALSGTLNVANDVGVGCRFVLDLPLHRSAH
jgi:signal transduction histidine kinase